ncbi:MAG: hypothetical protein ACK4JD_12550 [Thermoflexales bacterium]
MKLLTVEQVLFLLTGIAAAALFLRQNGYRLTTTNEGLEAFTRYVAESSPEVPELAAWLKDRSTPTPLGA